MNNIKPLSIDHPVRGFVGLILSAYSTSLDENLSFSDLAWLGLALQKTPFSTKQKGAFKLLLQKVESFDVDASDNFTVHQAVGLIVGLKALLGQGLIGSKDLGKYKNYFSRLSNADWLRVREVAALFCFAFKSQPGFEDLSTSAHTYLQKEFQKNHAPLGITLFGLSQNAPVDGFISPEVEAALKKYLSLKNYSLDELSYLCLALKGSKLAIRQDALDSFQENVYQQLTDLVSENSDSIALLLTILQISSAERSGEKILEKLKGSQLKREVKGKVSEITKSDDTLLIRFKDSHPLNPLVFKSLSTALYAFSQVPLSKAYIFPPDLEKKIDAFLESTRHRKFRIVSAKSLVFLILVFDAIFLILALKYWWPLFDFILKDVENYPPGLSKNTLQVLSWFGFLYPFYIAANFNLGILSKGWVRLGELFATLTPETFLKKIRGLWEK